MTYSAVNYAGALAALLPTGKAWEWGSGGFGDSLLLATAQELARVGASAADVLDDAIALHRPSLSGHTLVDYQAVAYAATYAKDRKPLAAGFRVGDRAWSSICGAGASLPHVAVVGVVCPMVVGFAVGSSSWSMAARYYLTVYFDHSIIDSARLLAALRDYKQAHVYLFVQDVPAMD
jgi:hypothetical protein